jgi:hypothetical protein
MISGITLWAVLGVVAGAAGALVDPGVVPAAGEEVRVGGTVVRGGAMVC